MVNLGFCVELFDNVTSLRHNEYSVINFAFSSVLFFPCNCNI